MSRFLTITALAATILVLGGCTDSGASADPSKPQVSSTDKQAMDKLPDNIKNSSASDKQKAAMARQMGLSHANGH